jgi:hypothetical protein
MQTSHVKTQFNTLSPRPYPYHPAYLHHVRLYHHPYHHLVPPSPPFTDHANPSSP